MEEIVATNKKALRDFSILESFEAGIELRGTEVKSLREHNANLKDSFARIEKGELFLYNMHISPYKFGNIYNVDPLRVRKLLVHTSELKGLVVPLTQKGLTLVPLKVYFKKGIAKIELALAKGKRQFDKRQSLKRKEQQREMKRAFKDKKFK